MERGANPEAADYDGKTAIIHAAGKGHLKVVIALATFRANLEAADTVRHDSIRNNSINNYFIITAWSNCINASIRKGVFRSCTMVITTRRYV